MKKIMFIIFGSLIALVLFAAFYYGLFSPINLNEKSVGGETLVFQERTGDYKQSGPAMDAVYNDLKNNFGIECAVGFGIYYDNPQEVAVEKLRSEVGCILPESQLARVNEIQVSPTLKIKRNPVVKNIIGTFPYRNKISYVFGVMKVYPKISRYVKEHNYQPAPSMELYDQANGRIEYRMTVVEK